VAPEAIRQVRVRPFRILPLRRWSSVSFYTNLILLAAPHAAVHRAVPEGFVGIIANLTSAVIGISTAVEYFQFEMSRFLG
jgi:hypothetical protein